MSHLAHLPARGVLEVSGEDRVAFLQGLVSNDVALVAPGRAVWAALLTPQGKYLADFFILQSEGLLLLDVEAAQCAMLVMKLDRFRLRARAAVRDASRDWAVHAAWGGPLDTPAHAVLAPDPRLPQAGWRVLAAGVLPADTDAAAWDRHRLSLGLPDGTGDLEPDKTILLEANFDALDGVSWTKGCYMGQELTARTKYRGLIKRRLLPVEVMGDLPPPGTMVTSDGREIGVLRSGQGHRALATLRLDALDHELRAAGATLRVDWPDWLDAPG